MSLLRLWKRHYKMKRLLRGENVVVGTGARASIDDGIPGIVLTQPLTYVEALELNVVPEH